MISCNIKYIVCSALRQDCNWPRLRGLKVHIDRLSLPSYFFGDKVLVICYILSGMMQHLCQQSSSQSLI